MAPNPQSPGDAPHGGGGGARRHIDFLDSLRGIAAVVVLLYHTGDLWQRTERGFGTLASGLIDGESAVMFFFVLSGLVLALGTQNRRMDWFEWLVFYGKRVVRLFPAYYASIALVAAAMLVFPAVHYGHATLLEVDEGYRNQQLAFHLLLGVPGLDSYLVSPQIWSLETEMRASLLFPLLLLLGRLGRTIPAALFWVLVGGAVCYLVADHLEHKGVFGYGVLRPIPHFLLGVFLARWLRPLLALPGWAAALLGFGGLLLYALARTVEVGLGDAYVHRYFAGIGSTALILAAGNLGSVRSVLESRPLVWLGQRSYSFYLLHVLGLGCAALLLGDGAPLLVLFLLAFAFTVVITFPIHFLFEDKVSRALRRGLLGGAARLRRRLPSR